MKNKIDILLKKISPDKLEKIMGWRMLPEVTKYMYTEPKLTLSDQKKWYRRIIKDPSVKYWLINVNDLDIGILNLYDIDLSNRRCFWAYYIGDYSFRGTGLARHIECNIYDYVFYELKLNKLCCEVLAFNDKVISIHKKFGSEIEGTFKQHIYKNGEFLDVVRMAILKEKWVEMRKKQEYKKIIIED